MIRIYSFVFSILALASTSVYADKNGYYVESAYEKRNSEDTSSNNIGTWKFTAAKLTFGKIISEHWAIEGFLTQGLTSDKKDRLEGLIKVSSWQAFSICKSDQKSLILSLISENSESNLPYF